MSPKSSARARVPSSRCCDPKAAGMARNDGSLSILSKTMWPNLCNVERRRSSAKENAGVRLRLLQRFAGSGAGRSLLDAHRWRPFSTDDSQSN